MSLNNYDYHLMLRAANVKATIHELNMIPKSDMDPEEKLIYKVMTNELEKLANKLWQDGMGSTKGVNRSQPLFETK